MMMRTMFGLLLATLGITGSAAAQTLDSARVDAVIDAAFPIQAQEWRSRLTPDETMRQCSSPNDLHPQGVSEEIRKRETAKIVYPADGNFMGDWQKGEKLAQSGYGMRFTDYPPRQENGANCYACHQLSKNEVSYGTLGPSLREYGKLRNYAAADVRLVYEKIYNSHAALACSLMPRFGTNKILTVDQIKDLVALVMSPDSPVNK